MKFKNNLLANVALVSLSLVFGAGVLFAVNASPTTYYQDLDGDGFGDINTATTTEEQPDGFVLDSTDCDDTASTTNPGANEICDGVDNNCSGYIDDEGVQTAYYYDFDADGFGEIGTSTLACSAPSADYVEVSGDCDDMASSTNPNATEVCDGVDQNCNGVIDEGVTTTYYLDVDADSYGLTASTTQACALPDGYALLNNDCDDTRGFVYPGADELYNNIDDDCDGSVDEGFVDRTFYIDEDGDGYGSDATTSIAIEAPEGFVDNNNDCNDDDSNIHPNADEICDGVDNNCDGSIDEGTRSIFYYDGDNDGYGLNSKTIRACETEGYYVAEGGDCDDNNNTIHPGASEDINDGVDNNCNGIVDEVFSTYYDDNDGDGYGNALNFVEAFEAPIGYVENDDDCDDNNDTVYPGATELDDNIDNDCDGRIDEGINNDDNGCNCNNGDCDNDGDGYSYQYQHQNHNGEYEGEDNGYKNHGQYVSEMAHYTNTLKKSGEITGQQKGSIMSSLNKNKGKTK